jgi:hypothetical protein
MANAGSAGGSPAGEARKRENFGLIKEEFN